MRIVQILILLASLNTIKLNEYSSKCDLNDGCILSFQRDIYLVCKNLNNSFNPRIYSHCYYIDDCESIYLKPKPNSILKAENIANLLLFWTKLKKSKLTITISNLKGLENPFFSPLTKFQHISLNIRIFYSILDIYVNNSLIKNCDSINIQSFSYLNLNKFIFSQGNNFKTKICPQILNNLNINRFQLSYLIDSFYKKNILNFYKTKSILNVQINELFIDQAQNLALDKNLFNKNLFEQTKIFSLFGNINCIENDLFFKFKNLKRINLDIYNAKNLFHQGIDWIKSINSDLKVNLKIKQK